jgi:hypothetical protein
MDDRFVAAVETSAWRREGLVPFHAQNSNRPHNLFTGVAATPAAVDERTTRDRHGSMSYPGWTVFNRRERRSFRRLL